MINKQILGAVAVAVQLSCMLPFLRAVVTGRSKPRFISWLIWSALMLIVFLLQHAYGAGPGAWATAANALECLLIALFAIRYGDRSIHYDDVFCILTVLAAIPIWIMTADPLLTLIAVIFADLIAYAPTLRNAWSKPHEESALLFMVGVVAFSIALAAMESYSASTVTYPIWVIATSSVFIGALLVRRRFVRKDAAHHVTV